MSQEFENIDRLELGKLLQIKQLGGSRKRNPKKKSLKSIKKLRASGPPSRK